MSYVVQATNGFGINPSDFNGKQIYDWFVADATKGNHAAGKRASWWVAAALWQLGYGTSFGLRNIELETTGPNSLTVAWAADKAAAWKAWYAKSVGGSGGYFPSEKGSAALLKMQQDLANPTPAIMGPDAPKVVDIKTGGAEVATVAPAATCPPGYYGTPPDCKVGAKPGSAAANIVLVTGLISAAAILGAAVFAKKNKRTAAMSARTA